ncbi:hypothetical protein [Desulfosporosinus sp. SB140]|uniref:hypothetical protein n=1 Tax=Desulfosporosinus paludis TaxID=3115649 RepID=UPI00388F58D9
MKFKACRLVTFVPYLHIMISGVSRLIFPSGTVEKRSLDDPQYGVERNGNNCD